MNISEITIIESYLISIITYLLVLGKIWLAWYLIDKMTKYDLGCELIKRKNQALAIVLGFIFLGIFILSSQIFKI